MATMTDLPYELLSYIILLLVQSPGGAADFATIISVCRNFNMFAQVEDILEVVNFKIKLELKNFKRYQHINSLLVKCSEAGNVAAQFLLGKVILVSSSQLLLCEWKKVEHDAHPCDFATLSELGCILATDVPNEDHKVSSFMAYFLPEQVSNNEVSRTRLVHYQLVKVFLLNGSHRDLAEMSTFLTSYVRFFTSGGEEDTLLKCSKYLGYFSESIRFLEKQLMEVDRRSRFEGNTDAINYHIDVMKFNLVEFRSRTLRSLEVNLG
ncbi:uncharacterized protein LOC141716655 [Apium graveolens]|uniref:uncharacterized protein LOC141716655 n=1 Tax=Apium graveolens TaxID=4045 RepID=UPI003D798288